MIKEGDKIPSVTLKHLTDQGMEEISTDEVFKGKKAVFLCMPGAYTGTCSEQHLPGYLDHMKAFQEKGINTFVCMTVNDPFVMKVFAQDKGASGKMIMLPDGNATLTKAMGLDFDASGFGLATRSLRCSMLVEDGVVTKMLLEDNPTLYDKSKAENLLKSL